MADHELPKLQYTSKETAPAHCRLQCEIRPDGIRISSNPRGIGRGALFALALFALALLIAPFALIGVDSHSSGASSDIYGLGLLAGVVLIIFASAVRRNQLDREPIVLEIVGDLVTFKTHTSYRRRSYLWKREHISVVTSGPQITLWNRQPIAPLRLIFSGGVVIDAFPAIPIKELNWLLLQLGNYLDGATA